MDFSRQIWEQKRPVFLQYTQCNDPRETAHTWWGGKGFPGATRVLVGVAMVMINFHVELCVESYALDIGTGLLGERRLSPNQYQYLMHRKCCRKDIFQVANVSCLEKLCPRGWAPGFWIKTCSRKWPICVMLENKNFEIWHWAPSNTYHMKVPKQLSNITIHQ